MMKKKKSLATPVEGKVSVSSLVTTTLTLVISVSNANMNTLPRVANVVLMSAMTSVLLLVLVCVMIAMWRYDLFFFTVFLLGIYTLTG